MEYLTVKEVSELKGCSEQYLKKCAKDGKLQTEMQMNPATKKMRYMFPITALPEQLQQKYYKQKRTETGIVPEQAESEPEKTAKTDHKYGSNGIKRPFESFSETEREQIRFWIDLLEQWQAERAKRKDKTEFDKIFVAHQKYLDADLSISPDILYRKYAAYKQEVYEQLLDNRGGWNRGKSKLADDSLIWQSFLNLYLDQSDPKIRKCYRMVSAYIAEEHPELIVEIPSEACFRRKIKTLPFAVMEYSHEGNKALHDHCTPHANRRKDNIYANDGWVMDNYTFDVIVKEDDNSEKKKRMYLTTVLDVKSGVLVGWNITDSPDSRSTLDALRFAMIRFGIPKRLYFDNGREFTALDIAGDKRRRKVAKDKKGNLPITIVEKLGIKLIFAKVTNAQAKVVERIHRIIKEQFCASQNGYCGGNIMERPEIVKTRIKNGDIETETELREAFADYADNVLNVAAYGGDEAKYKGMTAIDVWNASIAETSLRKANAEVLDLLMLRNNGFQKIKRDGVFITFHGKKIWYYDEHTTWQHIGEKVCVRYDRNDPSTVRLYDTEDRYLFSWQCADWLITQYFDESREILAELGRQKASVTRQIKERADELQGGKIRLTHKDGLRYLSRQNANKFEIRLPKNIIPIMVHEECVEEKQAVGAENIEVPVDIKKITRNAAKRKEKQL